MRTSRNTIHRGAVCHHRIVHRAILLPEVGRGQEADEERRRHRERPQRAGPLRRLAAERRFDAPEQSLRRGGKRLRAGDRVNIAFGVSEQPFALLAIADVLVGAGPLVVTEHAERVERRVVAEVIGVRHRLSP